MVRNYMYPDRANNEMRKPRPTNQITIPGIGVKG